MAGERRTWSMVIPSSCRAASSRISEMGIRFASEKVRWRSKIGE